MNVIYIAVGNRSFQQFTRSYRSLRRQVGHRAVRVNCVTDQSEERLGRLTDVVWHPIAPDREPAFWLKPFVLGQLERFPGLEQDTNLFLDCDTAITNPRILAPAKALDRYDVAMAYAWKRGYREIHHWPNCVPSFNSGVIYWERGVQTHNLFREWWQRYEQGIDAVAFPLPDQPILTRKALAAQQTGGLRILVLPDEWNWRGPMCSVREDVVIIHRKGVNNRIRRDGSVPFPRQQ